jgi:hypothetical protein
MKIFHCMILVTTICGALQAWPQSAQTDPHIGYLYPAGGQQGETIRIFAGGQFLRGADSVMLSGEGIVGKVIHTYPPIRNINGDQRQELGRRLWDAWEKRLAELPPEERKGIPTAQAISPGGKKPKPATTDRAKLPDHPLFNRIEELNLWQLATIIGELRDFRKRQPNAQLGELVEIEIQIAADAAPGDRELRLGVRSVLTNPACFQVNTLPEVSEQEPNDPVNKIVLPETPPLELPVIINGQILPGDVDRFSFYGEKGQQLVADVAARHLIPYLADAVPGWFQAVVAVYDSSGTEVAYADDYYFNPDPVLVCTLPEDGVYELEIRDSIYRGREDFVYRAAVGELPFITHAFPIGGQSGTATVAQIGGYNLATDSLTLDTGPGSDMTRHTNLVMGDYRSNDVLYAVNDLPECLEAESDDAQQIALPTVVNGRIETPGDIDVFTVEGRAGDALVVEVFARRLHSPMDSLLRVMDAQGTILAWNDDHKDKLSELLTHHADSKVQVTLPEDGVYQIQVSDTQRNGGLAYAYRLHVRQPQPDFALLVTPSTLNIPAGRAAEVCVHVVRQDGFEGPVLLSLKDAPKGFRIDGGRIPADRESIRISVSGPLRPLDGPLSLAIEGTAEVEGATVQRTAIPADDRMQAFLPRHLVPAQQLLASVKPGGRNGQVWRQQPGKPILIPRGGKTSVAFKTPTPPKGVTVKFELSDPPDGFAMEDIQFTAEGISFLITADENAPAPGYEDNLIVNATLERPAAKKGAPKKMDVVSLGVLPAIPIRITE